jgi:hypothetical protein
LIFTAREETDVPVVRRSIQYCAHRFYDAFGVGSSTNGWRIDSI